MSESEFVNVSVHSVVKDARLNLFPRKMLQYIVIVARTTSNRGNRFNHKLLHYQSLKIPRNK